MADFDSDPATEQFEALPMRIGLGTFTEPHEHHLRFIKQLGANDILLNLWDTDQDVNLDGVSGPTRSTLPLDGEKEWALGNLVQLRNQIEDAGLRLNAIENLPYSFYDKIMLGKDGRDEQLEHVKNTIRNIGRAGIPFLGYNWMPNGVWRTSMTKRIRGGAQTGAVDAHELEGASMTHERKYTEEEMWEYYEDFLNEVIPVAEGSGVTLALHPDDPPVESLGGIPRLFRNFENFKRAMAIKPSDNHGLQFCLGNWSAMGEDIHDVIEYFGTRGEISHVHFQTVSGPLPKFYEVFIDQEGYFDPVMVIQSLRDVKFDGLIIPGHAPKLEGDGE